MSAERPNVVVVLTDQQRWDAVGAYGCPMDLTPELDAAAEEGTRIETAITPQPVCAPARGCLQTGRYATSHGVWRNGLRLEAERTIAGAFAAAGYDTGYVGKLHLAGTGVDQVPEDARLGYEYWRVADALELTSHPYEGLVYDEDGEPVEFSGYRVDRMTDMAIDFVERDREGPFFLFLSQLEPHHQNDHEAYVAPDGYAERYADPWVPPDLRGRPGDWQDELPDYYGCCRRLDEEYGRLRAALAEAGELENTIVLFTSDHGSHFRTRNAEYKRSPHESSIRVPMVFTGPGFEDGGVVDDVVSLVDVPPTLLDAAGVDVPDAMEGESVVPLVRGDGWDRADEAFVQLSESHTGRALRTDRWLYAVAAADEDGDGAEPASDAYRERYLYDLAADPHQAVNLVGRPDHRDVADDLRERLLGWIERVEGDRPEIARARLHA